MTKRRNFKSIVSLILAICMMASLIPNVFAAQSNEYTDPAEVWLSSNNRTVSIARVWSCRIKNGSDRTAS